MAFHAKVCGGGQLRERDAKATKNDAAQRRMKTPPVMRLLFLMPDVRASDYGHADKAVQVQDVSTFVGLALFLSFPD
jgi:hypothetical protein